MKGDETLTFDEAILLMNLPACVPASVACACLTCLPGWAEETLRDIRRERAKWEARIRALRAAADEIEQVDSEDTGVVQ